MPNSLLLTFDDVEIIGGSQVHKDQWVLLVVGAALREFPEERDKDTVGQRFWESGGRERDVVGPFTFRSRLRVGQGLEVDQGLHAEPSNLDAGPIGGVVAGKPE